MASITRSAVRFSTKPKLPCVNVPTKVSIAPRMAAASRLFMDNFRLASRTARITRGVRYASPMSALAARPETRIPNSGPIGRSKLNTIALRNRDPNSGVIAPRTAVLR